MSRTANYLTLTAPNRFPRVTRWVLSALRHFTPALKTSSNLILLKADLVEEVLSRSTDFELGPVAERKMLMGLFLLGMDPWPEYQVMLKKLTQAVARRNNEARKLMAESAPAQADVVADRLNRNETVDLIGDFASLLLSRATLELTGVSSPVSSRVLKADDLFGAMSRNIGSIIASSEPAPFGLQESAAATTKELAQAIDRQITQRINELRTRHMPNPPASKANQPLLDELILNDNRVWQREPPGLEVTSDVRAKLAGLVLAGSTPIVKAFANAVEGLLINRHWQINGNPALETAITVANAPASPGQVAAMRQIFHEALRFKPVFPILLRYAPRRTVIGTGTRKKIVVEANTTVVCAALSAMFDDETVQYAETFTCPRSSSHLHFGGRDHHCIGHEMATLQIIEMMIALFGMKGAENLKHVKTTFDGPALHQLQVTYR